MTKLYPRTFAMYAEDRAIDAQLNSRCETLAPPPPLKHSPPGRAWLTVTAAALFSAD
jgi:hypothetical protein